MNDNLKRPFAYPVLSAEAVDGDTVAVVLDTGFGNRHEAHLRVNGVDTPETHGPGAKLQGAAGRVATAAVRQWLERDGGVPRLMCESFEKGKYYGRFVGDLYPADAPESTLSGFLLQEGLAHEYDGGTRQPWTDEELQVIEARAGEFMAV